MKNQAQRFPARGVNVRRLDHFNCLAVDVQANREFFERYLGFRLTEHIVLNDGTEPGMWLTCTNKSYDFAYTRDRELPYPRYAPAPRPARRRRDRGPGRFVREWNRIMTPASK